ncbi:FAD/NAD(P)-binding domain-containing protein [Violaceomyces palustris]|uniref:FAD/NAD(P)-binding domain-containing protein n=1 Tax=Violaceomyces palustris TaxID=1673888 RepID=A0ACD0NXH4_9BASI|nr:FAD/NAD(P)-binding domain-containing protein [Violaceomyces palustris]
MISSLARKSTVAVVGGSYVGLRFAKSLAASLPQTHKVVIVENNTHFNHLFTFPRFAVLPRGGEEKAFVPYSNVFDECPPGSGRVIQAKALSIHANEKANEPGYLQLDKEVDLDGEKVDRIPFDYLALATGTRLQVPWSMPSNDKTTGVKTLRETQDRVAKAKKIVIVGGGAVGVQVAFDISQLYQLGDDKVVTLVHSRDLIMNKFHPDLHKLVSTRLAEGGVQTKLGARVSLPASGYPDFKPGQFFKVELQNGDSIEGDLVLLCTGQTPRSDLLGSFSPSSITSGGFINVGPTLQVQAGQEIEAKAGNLDYKTSSLLDRIYALGDVADSGAPKTVRAAMGQVETVRANILASIKAGGKGAELKKFTPGPAGIHLTLGLVS